MKDHMKELGFDKIFKDYDLKEHPKEVNTYTVTIDHESDMLLKTLRSYGFNLSDVIKQKYNEVLTKSEYTTVMQCPSCNSRFSVVYTNIVYLRTDIGMASATSDTFYYTGGMQSRNISCFECGQYIPMYCGKIQRIEMIGEVN